MEFFGRVFIVLCLGFFATPLRSARIIGVTSLAASTPLPDSDNQDSPVGQKAATDASDAVMAREVASTMATRASNDDVIKFHQAADNAEKQHGHTFNQSSAHPRAQIDSEPGVSSTEVQDGKAKMRTTLCLSGKCQTENAQRAFDEHLGDPSSDVAELVSDTVPKQEAGSTTTTHASKDEGIKSLAAEEAAVKHDKHTFNQVGVHPRSKAKPGLNAPSTITLDGKGSLVYNLRSKPFMFLEVFSIFAFMGVLGYVFSLCLSREPET